MKNAIGVLARTASDGYIKVLHANLTRDTYSVVTYDAAMELSSFGACKSLSSYTARVIESGCIHEDDLTDFRAYTSLEFLRNFFRENHGKNIHWINYRRKSPDGYRWSVLEIQSAEDYADDDVNVYIMVKDVQASFDGQPASIGSVLRALCGGFDSIYCLDLERGDVVPYRSFDHNIPSFDGYLRTNPSYRDLISRYIIKSVFSADRNHLTRISSLEFIREYLAHRNSFSSEYRTVYNEEIQWYRIHFSRVDQKHAAIGLSNITDEKRMESDFYRDSKTVLVVDSDAGRRDKLCDILKTDFPVLAAESGEEALRLLLLKQESIAVVLADAKLNDMRGCHLISMMKLEPNLSEIPVMIADDGREHAEAYILDGASDILERPIQAEVLKKRVSFMIQFQDSSNMLNFLERDFLTGLYSKAFFFRNAAQMMREKPGKNYAILLSDVEHFHFYKERYGQEAADELLKNMALITPTILRGYYMGGRISEDIFAYLIQYSSGLEEDISAMQRCFASVSSEINHSIISVKYGLYLVDEDIPVSTMCDRAVIAVKSIKGVYGRNLAEYDMALREQMLNTQQIVENAENSLDKDQFEVYYQPKHDIRNGGVDGAEAVIRWHHPVLGFMNPTSFIPLFEKNGFIDVLDRFVLNRVCGDISQWIREGKPVVPVSVNISRVDFGHGGFADSFIQTVDSYGLDHSLIHAEVTESGYSEDPEGITQEIIQLHRAGFRIELDDFGTGYSSLSALSTLPVDVLKLDMSLLRHENKAANRNVLEFSMKLAKILKMETVQEGVETREQLERVSALGCDHVQGFFFSRPLPKDQFISYCRNAAAGLQ